MNKLIGVLLILIAIYLSYESGGTIPGFSQTPTQKLKLQIEQDVLDSMSKAGIPASNGIHHVDIKFRSESAHEILKSDQPVFGIKKDGKIWLELEILELPDQESPGIITQTSVFDIKTNNKISEFAKTYELKKFGLTLKQKN